MRKRRGKGAGTIYRHKSSGRWCAELEVGRKPDGKPLRVRGYFPTRREAEGWLAEQAALNFKGLLADPSSITVQEWALRWLERKAREVRPNTLAAYHRELSLALPSLKNPQAHEGLSSRKLQEVKPAHIRALIDDLSKRYDLRTIRHVRQRLAHLFEEALRLE